MVLLSLAKAFSSVLLLTTYTAAQLLGQLTYDGEETMVIKISNPSEENITMIGSNSLFDRLNEVPYQPFSLTNITGSPVTLNGTRYQTPPLTDDAFTDILPGDTWSRAVNISNYILGSSVVGDAGKAKSECFVATLPTSAYGLNTTDFEPGEALANYYLTKGLSSIKITSVPIHFNYSVPLDFTNDQAKYIKLDAALRRVGTSGTVSTS